MTLPSVSTAGSLRMMARRRAIRATPMASVTVRAAGSPSGIAATARATAAVKVSTTGWRRRRPMAKVTAASARMATSTRRLNRAILRVSGVCSSWASEINCEMRPISVLSPVATTSPVPCP